MPKRDMATANGVWLLGLIFGIGVSTRLFAKASSTKISYLKLVKENNKYMKLHMKKNNTCGGDKIVEKNSNIRYVTS